MCQLLIIGAGPGGIALAAEARAVGIEGRPLVVFQEESLSPRSYDRVIYALGGTTPINFLRTLGIAFNDDGPIFDDAGATNVPGLYLLGDLVVGKKGGSIITAFNSAVRAMKRIFQAATSSN